MKITINEPATGSRLDLDAQPEDYNGEQGWRILSPGKDSFVIIQQDGSWTVADDSDINPELIKEISNALHPVARYNSL